MPGNFFVSRVSPTNTEVSDSTSSSTSSDSSIKSILKTTGLKKQVRSRRVTISSTSTCGYVDLALRKVGIAPLQTSFAENVSRESNLCQARDPEDVKEVKYIIKHLEGRDVMSLGKLIKYKVRLEKKLYHVFKQKTGAYRFARGVQGRSFSFNWEIARYIKEYKKEIQRAKERESWGRPF